VDRASTLALAAQRGDRASLEELVRATQADVWRLAAHLVDRASADDVTQEVYLRALPALATWRAEAPVRVWLLTIARRTCADVLRRRQRDRRLARRLAQRPQPDQDVAVPAATGAVDLAVLVQELDEDRRLPFVLTQVLGLSYAEAAEVCGCPIGTVRSRVARARDDIAAAMGEHDLRQRRPG
jgi:RNA polymerase sigma-70 factor (ECF subfamily)